MNIILDLFPNVHVKCALFTGTTNNSKSKKLRRAFIEALLLLNIDASESRRKTPKNGFDQAVYLESTSSSVGLPRSSASIWKAKVQVSTPHAPKQYKGKVPLSPPLGRYAAPTSLTTGTLSFSVTWRAIRCSALHFLDD